MKRKRKSRAGLIGGPADLRRRLKKLEGAPAGRGRGAVSRGEAVADATAGAILEASAEGILMTARDGAIVLANGKLAEMFGYAREELLGQPMELLLPERLREVHAEHRGGYFAQPRRRPMGRGLDLVGRRKDGTEFPIEVSLSYMESEDGIRAMALVTDITERKRVETALNMQFAVTRVFAESDTLQEATSQVLQAICEGLRWEAGELWRVDSHANVLRREGSWHVPTLDIARFEAASHGLTFAPGVGLPGKVWASGEPAWVSDVTSDATFVRGGAARETRLHAALAFPIVSRGEVLGVMAFFTRGRLAPDPDILRVMADIGQRVGHYMERRRVEEELKRQREALSQGEKLAAIGRLAAGVVHEMNNPLAIMLSRIEVMLIDAEGQNLPAAVLEDLRTLHRNTQRVARVARSLLSFARQSSMEQRPLDLNGVVEETLLLVEKPMTAEGIRITTALDRSLPPLLGDSGALQQVLVNLLTNAREAMAGGGEIRIETGPAPGRPGWLRLVVGDNGPGIAPDHLPKIFDPFYTTKPDGTGLGLSVSYGIVQEHQGTIDVESQPGKGTTFVLTLPAAGAEGRG